MSSGCNYCVNLTDTVAKLSGSFRKTFDAFSQNLKSHTCTEPFKRIAY